uniref:pectinesterase/pectinesterase inhibitor PPE8B-like n=1 Tax=Erigeron canadensis TaxID=72917 RepID=UPI001CB8E0F3|nr:pectinesterase/pectinesterase inhibitor PPE8B-like [Erigeron canadensis]
MASASTTKLTLMMILVLLVSSLCLFSPTPIFAANTNSASVSNTGGGGGGVGTFTDLKVPGSEFVNSVTSTIQIVRDVISVVSKFSGGDFRVSNAIADCVDLLDFSADELTWTLSASQNPSGKTGKYNSTGNNGADMRTWLGGALGNQDTCMDGFEGTNSFVKTLVGTSIGQVTSLVRDILGMVNGPDTNDYQDNYVKRRKTRNVYFPGWVKEKDRKLLQVNGIVADAVVAADGSGNFTRIVDAVDQVPDHNTRRYVIYVKTGVYREYVEIGKKKTNIMMIGDGIDRTVITGNHNFVDGWTTYRSATFAVKGQGFIARDIRFENTAGPEKHQAVAFRSDSDLSVVFRCAITGYQDTLYAHSMRQFYRECLITGTVDFIFGDGAVVFQNCQILARKGLPNQKNTITAQGRKEPTQPSGFSIQFSNISVEPELLAQFNNSNSNTNNSSTNIPGTYLGRPWKQYSRTVVMQSYISALIRPQGWLEWNGDFALDTLYYAEYMNYGPGAALGDRVRWPGLHAINDSSQAKNFTVAQFLLGNSWLPSTGVKYTAGLMV